MGGMILNIQGQLPKSLLQLPLATQMFVTCCSKDPSSKPLTFSDRDLLRALRGWRSSLLVIDVRFLLRGTLFPLNELSSSSWLTLCTVPPQPATTPHRKLGA